MKSIVVATACVLALAAGRSGNLDAVHNVGFHVPSDSTVVILDAVDDDGAVWASDEIAVTGPYMEWSLNGLKAQLPLSGYPELTLRLTVTAGAPGCGCLGDESVVTILDLNSKEQE